jgi:NADPH:quinone reductase-like Zn-dependent oxidoreductase
MTKKTGFAHLQAVAPVARRGAGNSCLSGTRTREGKRGPSAAGPLAEAAAAHAQMESNRHIGKIILSVQA